MTSKRSRGRMAALLAFAALATQAPTAPAGPISDMLARHRQARQMRIPPMDKPFSTRPVRDLNSPGMVAKFKQRFSTMRPSGPSMTSGGWFSPKSDSGVMRTSR